MIRMSAGRCFVLAKILALSMLGVMMSLSRPVSGADEPQPSRFSQEAVELMTLLSNKYDLNGKTVASKPHVHDPLTRLEKSADLNIRMAATLALTQQEDLQKRAAERQAFGRLKKSEYTRDDLENLEKEYIKPLLLQRAEEAKRRKLDGKEQDKSESDKESGGDLLRVAYALMFKMPVDRGTSSLKITLKALCNNVALRQALRNLAKPVPVAFAMEKPVAVRVDSKSGRDAFFILTNKTGRTLHSCLVISSVVPDRERLLAQGADAEVLYAGIKAWLASPEKPGERPTVGDEIAGGFVDAGAKVARIKFLIAAVEQGCMIYVPELPANAEVKVWLCPTYRLQIAKSVEISLWCDELSVDGVRPENLEDPPVLGGSGIMHPLPSDTQSFSPLRSGTLIRLSAAGDGKRHRTFSCYKAAGASYRATGETLTIDSKGRTSLRLRALAVNSEGYIAHFRDPATRKSSFIFVPRSQVLEGKD
jgi:hypothetical protein